MIDLTAIEKRAKEAEDEPRTSDLLACTMVRADIPALCDEVRRLRKMIAHIGAAAAAIDAVEIFDLCEEALTPPPAPARGER